MRICDFFDKGYYINLDRRTDRRELFEQEMSNYDLLDFFERVSGVDSINETDHVKKHCYCSLTYINLFKEILESNHERILIFEDDAYFYNDTQKQPGYELIQDALDELQNFDDWQMIYFGGHPIHEVEIVSKTLMRAPTILTTHAVGYKRSLIQRVVDQYKPFSDSAIDGWYGQRHDIIKYLVNPIAVAQREGESDLDAWGRSAGIFTFLESYRNVRKIETS